MSHFAEVDENGLVLRVLVGDNSMTNEGHDWFIKNLGGLWIQTSYRGSVRKNFASVGFSYDKDRDAFIPPKPYNSWILDEETCLWNPPVKHPEDGQTYQWSEEETSWELSQPPLDY